jgi:hypothetical protein
MKTVSIVQSGKGKRGTVLLLAAFLALPGSAASLRAAATPAPKGLQNEQEILKKQQQEYNREHTNASGKLPADAYVKGIEHVRQMKVAPYIGAKPLGGASPKPLSAKPKTN